MKHCPNSNCAGLKKNGIESEFGDDAFQCADCGWVLVPGSAPSRPQKVEERRGTGPFVVAGNFLHAHEAYVARALLESAGIPTQVADDSVIGLNYLLSSAVGGVKVLVPEGNLLEAQEILNDGGFLSQEANGEIEDDEE
jgi:hypothetical protein